VGARAGAANRREPRGAREGREGAQRLRAAEREGPRGARRRHAPPRGRRDRRGRDHPLREAGRMSLETTLTRIGELSAMLQPTPVRPAVATTATTPTTPTTAT